MVGKKIMMRKFNGLTTVENWKELNRFERFFYFFFLVGFVASFGFGVYNTFFFRSNALIWWVTFFILYFILSQGFVKVFRKKPKWYLWLHSKMESTPEEEIGEWL